MTGKYRVANYIWKNIKVTEPCCRGEGACFGAGATTILAGGLLSIAVASVKSRASVHEGNSSKSITPFALRLVPYEKNGVWKAGAAGIRNIVICHSQLTLARKQDRGKKKGKGEWNFLWLFLGRSSPTLHRANPYPAMFYTGNSYNAQMNNWFN